MNKYLADSQNKVLRGPVELPNPNDFDYITNPGYNKRFENHIASLPTIKAEWLTDIDNQKYFELGKDFTIHYDGYFEGVGESTAVPIDKQEGKPERMFTQSQVISILDILLDRFGVPLHDDREEFLQETIDQYDSKINQP